MKDFLFTLEDESNSAGNLFRNNNMVGHPDKFLAIILNKKESDTSCILNIDQNLIEWPNTVKLSGVNINHKLRFDFQVSKLCYIKQQYT